MRTCTVAASDFCGNLADVLKKKNNARYLCLSIDVAVADKAVVLVRKWTATCDTDHDAENRPVRTVEREDRLDQQTSNCCFAHRTSQQHSQTLFAAKVVRTRVRSV